ncbi:hypothetical protein D9619_002291 [Psilocybe cf. subviscida]|uniref:Uncharacterized protein n=1 Tax=Psilocybe cf. subviscida TaxID=2480587 RepID=A0A8H5BGT1_9AGAR|nr:hypothetical protein D9619_002291 [Psilocybe cf. subviscida]
MRHEAPIYIVPLSSDFRWANRFKSAFQGMTYDERIVLQWKLKITLVDLQPMAIESRVSAYTVNIDDPFVIRDRSPNYSSVSPPLPDDLIRPLHRLSGATWYLVGRSRIVGLVETWAQASEAIAGIPNGTVVSIRGWDEAVRDYASAFRANALIIEPTITPFSSVTTGSRTQPHIVNSNASTPARGATGSRTQPYIVNSNASTPARGAAHRPISVHSSPAPQGPPAKASTPARNTLCRPVSVHANPVSPPSCQPAGWVGSTHNPMMGSASPTPTATHPNTPTKRTSMKQAHAHRANTPDASAARLRTISEALGSTPSSSQTPTPIAPRHPVDPESLAVRLRAVEHALEHYTIRNSVTPPSPTTPTSGDSSLVARIIALEECTNNLLTREAERLSAEEERRALRNAVLTRAFQECRNHMLADGIITTTAAPPSGQADGRDPTPPTSPVAGSSTGPGTATHATSLSNGDSTDYFAGYGTFTDADKTAFNDIRVQTPVDDIDYFSGYEDFSEAEEAALNDLLDDIDSAYKDLDSV